MTIRYHFRTVSDEFSPLCGNFFDGLVKTEFYVSKGKTFEKICLFKKLLFFSWHFWTLNKTSSAFIETFLAASSDKRSTCPWEQFEEKKTKIFRKKIILPTTLGTMSEKYCRLLVENTAARFSKLHKRCAKEIFKEKTS